MCTPIVSIIVPIYKVEKYLCRAVDSLIEQSYANIEIILVDDGSPDRCPRICDEYATADKRVKVIHKTNGGLSDARNAGIEAASGDLLFFVDSDDYLRNDAIAVLVRNLIDTGADIVCCGVDIVDENGETYERQIIDTPVTISGTNAVKKMFSGEFPHNYACNKLFRKKLFNGVRFPVGRLYEDIATIYLAVSRAAMVRCIPESLYCYERGRIGNISSELTSSKAARSYYHGVLNAVEHILFCKERQEYNDIFPTIEHNLYIWGKLCLEAATKLGRREYREYHGKILSAIVDNHIAVPSRLSVILRFSSLFFCFCRVR